MEPFSEYFRKDHILSRTDARVKLLAGLTVLAMVLSYRGFALPALVAALSLLLCRMMRVPFRFLMLRFSEPVFIAAVILVLKFFFSGSDSMFSFTVAGIRICGYRDGLFDGLMIAARILGAVSVVAVIGFSTPFTEFMAGLSWLRVPRSFIEILMFAYRYIFVLLEDAMVIYNAQKNRLGYSSLGRGLNSFGVLSGSLILKAFEHSQSTTVAMVQRGYDGNLQMLRHRPFRLSEIMVSLLFIIALGLVWRM